MPAKTDYSLPEVKADTSTEWVITRVYIRKFPKGNRSGKMTSPKTVVQMRTFHAKDGERDLQRRIVTDKDLSQFKAIRCGAIVKLNNGRVSFMRHDKEMENKLMMAPHLRRKIEWEFDFKIS